jgi:predicted Zn-dependent peptidase
MMLGLENMSGRMMRLGSTELYFESFTSLDEIIRRVDAVTSEELQSVANDLFRAETFSTVIVRPA